jgi:hypothetical protein
MIILSIGGKVLYGDQKREAIIVFRKGKRPREKSTSPCLPRGCSFLDPGSKASDQKRALRPHSDRMEER